METTELQAMVQLMLSDNTVNHELFFAFDISMQEAAMDYYFAEYIHTQPVIKEGFFRNIATKLPFNRVLVIEHQSIYDDVMKRFVPKVRFYLLHVIYGNNVLWNEHILLFVPGEESFDTIVSHFKLLLWNKQNTER